MSDKFLAFTGTVKSEIQIGSKSPKIYHTPIEPTSVIAGSAAETDLSKGGGASGCATSLGAGSGDWAGVLPHTCVFVLLERFLPHFGQVHRVPVSLPFRGLPRARGCFAAPGDDGVASVASASGVAC